VDDFVVEEALVDGSRAEIDQSRRSVSRETSSFSPFKQRYLLCVLVKRNWDTFHATRVVAEQLGIDTNCIHFAGIKDAKAVTAQHITVEGVTAEEIKKVQAKDIKIRPIGYFRSKLSSYFLLGNNFHVTIRAVNHGKATTERRIAKTVERLEANGGIPNFFGHQRFGTIRPITHLVGKAIVEGNFRKAALLFLAKPSLHEHPESRWARQQLRSTQDFGQALKNFPKQLSYEKLMIRHLIRNRDDYLGAFRRLPVKLRELFPQAYQSCLFNRFLSGRIARGLSLVRAEVGDWVVNVERSGLPMLTVYKTVEAETLTEINTAIEVGRMRLAIPLIGFKQHTSLGVQGEIEKLVLEEEGIVPENFKISLSPEMAARGELRTVVTPLKDFSLNEVSEDSENPSKYKVDVRFALNRGSYATILLRELMKPRNLIKAGF
jgi:tRNA pseudouridine13 synthase